MPLEWKTTRVGDATVVHWKQHNPIEVLSALETEPIDSIGKHPRVNVHRFGPHHIAVRSFNWADIRAGLYLPASELFTRLRELVDKKKAILEMPVALIQRKNTNPIIVTLWKKKTRNLQEVLADSKTTNAEKAKACITASRKLAILHSLGYLHVHPHADNFVVSERGESYFADYTLFRNFNLPGKGLLEAKRSLKHISKKYSNNKAKQRAIAAKMTLEYAKERLKAAVDK